MTPNVRRAMHQALDIILDALAEEAAIPKRKRTRADEAPPLPEGVTAADIARVDAKLQRAGFRKKAA